MSSPLERDITGLEKVSPALHLKKEIDPVSETLCFLII
jgi:hypothetical protein